MAKSKKYISSKVKRKFAVGGPYKDVEAELYNPNADRTIYQAADQPSTILQQQQEAMLQQQAAANKSMYQNQLNAELARNQAQQQQTANLIEEEKTARKAEEQKQKQALATQATKGATKLGKEAAKNFTLNPDGKFINTALQSGSYYSPTWTSTTAAPTAPITAAPIVGTESVGTGALTGSIAPAGAVEVGQNLATTTSTGADVAGKAASGASLGSAAAGIGLGLAGEGLGMYATYKQRKEDDAAKRSQYYRDTDYTRREALGQIGKSTLKGAGIGVGAGTTLGLGVGSVPAGVVGGVIGGVAGLGYGVGKALHEERLTKSEADRGIKIGNKRIGKKLLFGDENVYSAAKDPYEIAKAQYQDSLEKQAQLASAMDAASLASRTTEVNTGFNVKGSNMAKYGGSIEYLKGGIAKPLPRGAKEYIGNKHEEGGIDLPGNINVEGGETEQDNYIFSATLKLPTGLTYAQAHKNLLASGASSEEIKQLALSQEAAAGRNPNQIKTMKFAKHGGSLKYENGGPELNYFTSGQFAKDQMLKNPEIINTGRSKEYWQAVDCIQDPESCIGGKRTKASIAETFAKRRNYNMRNFALGYNKNGARYGADQNAYNMFMLNREDYLKAEDPDSMKYLMQTYQQRNPDGTIYNSQYVENPDIRNKIEKPFTPEEIAYYKGETNNPDTYNIVYDERLTPTIKVGGRSKDYWQNLSEECYRNPGSCTSQEKKYALRHIVRNFNGRLRNEILNLPYNNLSYEEFVDKMSKDRMKSSKDYLNPSRNEGLIYSEGLEFIPSKEEFEFYKGLRSNPDSEIYNPNIGTTIPKGERMSAELPGMGTAVNFTPTSATEYSAEAAKNLPKTTKAREAFNKLQNKLKEKAIQKAENNKIYNAPTLPEVVINSPNSQQENLNLIQGKDVTKIQGPTSNLELAQYNLSEINMKPGVSTFVPDEIANQIEDNKIYQGTDLPEVVINASRPKTNTQVVTTKKDPTEGMTKEQRLDYYRKQRNLPEGTVMLPPTVAGSKAQKDMLLNEDKEFGNFQSNIEPIVESNENLNTENKKNYKMEFPPPPKYIPTKSTNNIGLLQTIPAAFAMGRPINVSPISPALASGYVQAGSIGKVNLGRVQMNAERAANQQNAAAINQALQNMSGPGAIAGMVAAKTKADQQNLAIAQAEQNANVGLAAKEQELNTGISRFNVGSTMQAQTTNAGIAQQNAARIQQANQFNEQLKYTKNVENRDQMLSALDRATAAIVQNNLANKQLDATERLASIYDAYNAYNRYLEASQKEPEKKKFGGVKKYVSRLGDLKNVKYKV